MGRCFYPVECERFDIWTPNTLNFSNMEFYIPDTPRDLDSMPTLAPRSHLRQAYPPAPRSIAARSSASQPIERRRVFARHASHTFAAQLFVEFFLNPDFLFKRDTDPQPSEIPIYQTQMAGAMTSKKLRFFVCVDVVEELWKTSVWKLGAERVPARRENVRRACKKDGVRRIHRRSTFRNSV